MSNVRNFGAAGDGETDDTDALQHAIDQGDGELELPRGEYRITKPLVIDLQRVGRTSLHGSGGTAKLRMYGPGPAILLRGTHTKTAHPEGFRSEEWLQERMPTLRDLEIEGRHPLADGVRIEGVMQPTLTGLLIRQVRHGVHITNRARNVLLDHCHIYHNTGVGVYLDSVNLHQTNITGCHISYCLLGGIRIENSEVRNLQITGNDIEYNNNRSHQVPQADLQPTAEIYIDVRNGSVREGTISGNTLQATYSPGGANIRFIGRGSGANHKVGMWTITGNLIGSQETNIHLSSARGVTISGNYIYSGHHRNLLVEDCRNIVVGPNCFGHNPDYGNKQLATGMRFVNSQACTLSGIIIEDSDTGGHTVDNAVPIEREALVELVDCEQFNFSGCQFINGVPYALQLDNCSWITLNGCSVIENRKPQQMRSALNWTGTGKNNLITGCQFETGIDGGLNLPDHVHLANNQLVSDH